jgi:hypothetical protein
VSWPTLNGGIVSSSLYRHTLATHLPVACTGWTLQIEMPFIDDTSKGCNLMNVSMVIDWFGGQRNDKRGEEK